MIIMYKAVQKNVIFKQIKENYYYEKIYKRAN